MANFTTRLEVFGFNFTCLCFGSISGEVEILKALQYCRLGLSYLASFCGLHLVGDPFDLIDNLVVIIQEIHQFVPPGILIVPGCIFHGTIISGKLGLIDTIKP